MQGRYAAPGDWLRPCWWRHGFVVEELSALRSSWLGVYSTDEPPAHTAALTWHEQSEKCRDRIRRTISTGPGCTAVSHKPDQSVTDDPRWADERAAVLDEAARVLLSNKERSPDACSGSRDGGRDREGR